MEIMVALGLSLVLGLMALEHLRVAREASRGIAGRSDTQHEASLALDLLRTEIRRAGYLADAQLGVDDVFPPQSFLIGDDAQNVNVPGAAVAFVGASSDLWLRFQARGDRWDGDCLGSSTSAAGTLVVERLWVDAQGLHCGVWREQGYKTALLLEGVEAWVLAIGVDTDGNGSVDSYVAPRDVTDWSAAVGLEVRVRTVSARADAGSVPAPFIDLDGTPRTPTDLRVRRVAAGIVPLKGRGP